MRRKRPFGLKVVIAYFLFLGIVSLLAGVLTILIKQTGGDTSGLPSTAHSIFLCISGSISLISLFGLWFFQEWARKIAFWFLLAGVLYGLVIAIIASNALVPNLVGVSMAALVVFYLSRARVKALFVSKEKVLPTFERN